MAEKNAGAFPHIDYSNIDIYVEEAKNIEVHRPAMVTLLTFIVSPARIRIIPAKQWNDDIEEYTALFSHESLHIWLANNVSPNTCARLDLLPRPKSKEEMFGGVFGLGLTIEELMKLSK